MTVELIIAAIALGVGVGTFVGLCIHIGCSKDSPIKECSIDYLKTENNRLQLRNRDLQYEVVRFKSLNNDVASQNVYYREKNNKLEDENTALKLKINEMEESRRATLEHNAYLSKEATRLSEENKKLKKRQTEAVKYLVDGLRSRMNNLMTPAFVESTMNYERGSFVAYRRALDEIDYLKAKYESEDKTCSD